MHVLISAAIFCLCVFVVTCHETHQSVWTQPLPASSPSFGCVAVVTGYPEVARLKPLVTRLLGQLANDFHVDKESVHVFCQGDCAESFPAFPFQYHALNNTVDREKYRGFIIARNYKLLFQELFEQMDGIDYCLILEDDLVLAPDSIAYMEAGVELMDLDQTIFTVSLYNDNSYPWCASNSTFFRRIDHFSGLGFMMSKRWYLALVKGNWDEEKVWDHNLQTIMAENKMASVQPEVNRVLHSPDLKVTTTSETRPKYNKYLSQIASHSEGTHRLSHLHKEAYDTDIKTFITYGKVIGYLYDVAFYDTGTPLLYVGCDSERPCLDALLSSHGLNGSGLGHMIRGIYHGTMYIRVFGRLVLFVIPNSPFWKYIPQIVDDEVDDDLRAPADKTAALRGLLHHITHTYQLVTAPSSRDTSCSSVCRSVGGACTRSALWLLNTDCSVLQSVVAECTQCQLGSTSGAGRALAPSIDANGLCTVGSADWLTCDGEITSRGEGHVRRLCPCL